MHFSLEGVRLCRPIAERAAYPVAYPREKVLSLKVQMYVSLGGGASDYDRTAYPEACIKTKGAKPEDYAGK